MNTKRGENKPYIAKLCELFFPTLRIIRKRDENMLYRHHYCLQFVVFVHYLLYRSEDVCPRIFMIVRLPNRREALPSAWIITKRSENRLFFPQFLPWIPHMFRSSPIPSSILCFPTAVCDTRYLCYKRSKELRAWQSFFFSFSITEWVSLDVYLHVFLAIAFYPCPSVYLSACPFYMCLSVCLPIWLAVRLAVLLATCLSGCLSEFRMHPTSLVIWGKLSDKTYSFLSFGGKWRVPRRRISTREAQEQGTKNFLSLVSFFFFPFCFLSLLLITSPTSFPFFWVSKLLLPAYS